MIFLAKISNPRMAQAFVDYMATQGVSVELRPVEPTTAELWLHDEGQLELARAELQRFEQQPEHERYMSASWQVNRTDSHIRYPGFSYWRIILQGGGWVTHGTSLLCIVVYLLMLLTGGDLMFNLLSFPANQAQMLQIWRWFTPALLHFTWQHILFNLVIWWYLAGQVERVLGSRKLLTLTLLSAFFSSCAQYYFSGVGFGGLSGVVYALIGYVWCYGERRADSPLQLPRVFIAVIALWFVIDYFELLGPIGNAAHLSGLILGLLLALWDTSAKKSV
ncbi:MAG: rhomboid family intramembrane serine protease GlpG [Enterobacteriaceae bacterium]